MRGSHRDKGALCFKGQAYFSEVCYNSRRGSFSQDNDSLDSVIINTPSACTERGIVLATQDVCVWVLIACCTFTVVLLSSTNVRGLRVQWKGIGLLLKTVLTWVVPSHTRVCSIRILHMYKSMQDLIHRFSFILVKNHRLKSWNTPWSCVGIGS